MVAVRCMKLILSFVVVFLIYGLGCPVRRTSVKSQQSAAFLFASMLTFKPFPLNTFHIFFSFFQVFLLIFMASLSSLYSPTSMLRCCIWNKDIEGDGKDGEKVVRGKNLGDTQMYTDRDTPITGKIRQNELERERE